VEGNLRTGWGVLGPWSPIGPRQPLNPADSAPPQGQHREQASEQGRPTPRLLSAQAAAKYLGIPYTTLRDWVARGHISIVRVPDCRRLWFDRKDLDRSVDAWKERAEA
jgi:excisionase family DNA binding protein